jgi:hypothetical protein
MHAQRLEGARRGVFAVAGAHRAPHDLRELQRARDGRHGARRDDRLRDAAREPLFAELRDHLLQLPLVRMRHEIRGRRAMRGVHAHVERTVLGEAETARRIVELRRGDAEVEQHAAHRSAACMRCDHRAEPREIGADEFEPGFAREGSTTRGDGIGIPVEGEHGAVGADGLEQASRMSPASERAIDIQTTRRRSERFEHLVDKHRLVPIRVLHAITPCTFRRSPRRTGPARAPRPFFLATAATPTTTENPAPSTDRSRSPRS